MTPTGKVKSTILSNQQQSNTASSHRQYTQSLEATLQQQHSLQNGLTPSGKDQGRRSRCHRSVGRLTRHDKLTRAGTVGQRFIQLLSAHPYFQLHALGASSRSAGKAYGQVTKWKLTKEMPAEVRDLVVQECKPEAPGFKECAVIFSGLDAEVAGEIGQSRFMG